MTLQSPPTGNLTFMFTDIEGSTQLWEAFPEAMKSALARHDQLMNEIIESNHGYLVKTTGDGILAAFPEAVDGAFAAVEIHRRLQSEPWGEVGNIRVRIGIHSGEAQYREGDYYGSTINRAVRLMSIGHGGQVLLSSVTQELLAENLPPELSLKALGFHRLKDLAQPENVFQLIHPDLAKEFPGLKSLSYLANNLPLQTTSFVGREDEIVEVSKLLQTSRLVTLTGFGGAGKTRLSLQVAADLIEQYEDGVWFIELASLNEPSLVSSAIAQVLRVSETTGQPLLEALIDALRSKQMLLVLDNCEHLVDACAIVVSRLLKSCPKIHWLASSRERLNIEGESICSISPLPLPSEHEMEQLDALSRNPSIQLFAERAKSVKASFELSPENVASVTEICFQLDGIPLALELAAARLQMISSQKIAEMLDDRFRVLSGGKRDRLAHHQTLRAAIDWSYDLIDESERALLNRLSVFRGGFELEAVGQVCTDQRLTQSDIIDLLGNLVQKSLVEMDEEHSETRYRLLETVRQFAQEKLIEADEQETFSDAHFDCFFQFAVDSGKDLFGKSGSELMKRFALEHDNFRQALRWKLECGNFEDALKMGNQISSFWSIRGHQLEGLAWLQQAARDRDATSPLTLARALLSMGILSFRTGNLKESRAYLKESVSLYRSNGSRDNTAAPLKYLGILERERRNFKRAEILLEASLAIYRESGNDQGSASVLLTLGLLNRIQNELDRAYEHLRESVAIFDEIGDLVNYAIGLNNLGEVVFSRGDIQTAKNYLEQGLEITIKFRDKNASAYSINNLSSIYRVLGDCLRGAQLQGFIDAILVKTGVALNVLDQATYDVNKQEFIKQLGEDEYQRAFETGQSMNVDEAIDLALPKSTAFLGHN